MGPVCAVLGALVFARAFAYALYLVGAGEVIARMGRLRLIRLGDPPPLTIIDA